MRPKSKPICAFCNSNLLSEILDFGDVALAGGFLREDQFSKEIKFPLRVFFCEDCYAVQVVDPVDPNIMFKDYFYFSSQIRTLKDHFADFATEVASRFIEPRSATVLEFGCNDGVLLEPLKRIGVKNLIGVDPATNILNSIDIEGVNLINDFFTEKVAQDVVERFGNIDLIVANNVFAHIPDICGVTRAIKIALSDDGVLVFEVHYLGGVIQGLQYDMIYHEHLYYYSLITLQKHFARHGMIIFDTKSVPIHGGSRRFYVCKINSIHAKDISYRVTLLREEELELGYHLPSTYSKFANKVKERRENLMQVLGKLKKGGKKIAGYGASGRANTIIQFCGINHEHIDYIIDDAPAKTGYYTPGSHFKIKTNQALVDDRPDYILVFAWSFINEIVNKNEEYLGNGGKFLLPLPEVRLIMNP